MSGVLLGIIGSRILYLSDSDGNLLITTFCILSATCVTLIVWTVAKKIFSKLNQLFAGDVGAECAQIFSKVWVAAIDVEGAIDGGFTFGDKSGKD